MKLEIEIIPKSFSSHFRFSTEEINRMLKCGIDAARANNRAEARQLLQRVTEAEPENETAWLWLASISEYPEELLGFLQHVLKMNPQNEQALEWTAATKSLLADNFFQLGVNAVQDERKEFAQQCFSRTVSHDSQNENAWLKMSELAETPEEKISYLHKVLEINSNNDAALEGLAKIEQENLDGLLKKANFAAISGDRDEALQLIDEIMQSAPAREDVWILKAYLAQSSEEKIVGYKKVLEINPNNDAAQAGLAALEALIQKTEEQKPFAEALKAAFEASDLSKNLNQSSSPETFSEETQSSDSDEEFSALTVSEVESDEAGAVTENFSTAENDSSETEFSNPVSFDDSPEEVDEQVVLAAEETSNFSSEVTSIFADVSTIEEENSQPEFVNSVFQTSQNTQDFTAYAQNENNESAEKYDESDLLHLSDVPHSFITSNENTNENNIDDFYRVTENAMFSTVENHDVDFSAPENVELETSAEAEKNYSAFNSNNFSSDENYFSEEPTAQLNFVSNDFAEQIEESVECPFCNEKNETEAIICSSCQTMFSLSDLEMLLNYPAANPEVLQTVISRLETAYSNQTINADDMKTLAVAYLNKKDLHSSLNCLKEAAQFSPDDFEVTAALDFLKSRLGLVEDKPEMSESGRTDVKTSTIMVVDDNPTILKLVAGKLEKCGHTVIPALNGEEALTKMNEVKPDLILLDITMPKMDGYQVCQIIRSHEKTKNVPVLMISSKDGVFDESRGRKAGSTGFIAKPFGPETLMRTVENYLQ